MLSNWVGYELNYVSALTITLIKMHCIRLPLIVCNEHMRVLLSLLL